ncbi:MAG: ATP-binding protein [Thermoanaerobaculia bacterium]|nr:ATP-binding protein [Thermoanaerobaculia bacterium]
MPDESEASSRQRRSEAATMRFPRRVDALSSLFAFSGSFFAASGVDGQSRSTADFILEEIFTNQVKYNAEGAGEIEVSLRIAENVLEISVTDFDSERFDLREAGEVDVNAALNDRKPGGLGIHLVKKFAKRIDYDYVDRRSKAIIYFDLG